MKKLLLILLFPYAIWAIDSGAKIVQGKITSVYDGDTVTADIYIGFGIILASQKLRLFGINAPEIRGGTDASKARGREAKDFLKSKVLNKNISIVFLTKNNKEVKGKYGRYIVVLLLGDENINKLLVSKNHAIFKEY